MLQDIAQQTFNASADRLSLDDFRHFVRNANPYTTGYRRELEQKWRQLPREDRCEGGIIAFTEGKSFGHIHFLHIALASLFAAPAERRRDLLKKIDFFDPKETNLSRKLGSYTPAF